MYLSRVLAALGCLISGGSSIPVWFAIAFSWSVWMKAYVGLSKSLSSAKTKGWSDRHNEVIYNIPKHVRTLKAQTRGAELFGHKIVLWVRLIVVHTISAQRKKDSSL